MSVELRHSLRGARDGVPVHSGDYLQDPGRRQEERCALAIIWNLLTSAEDTLQLEAASYNRCVASTVVCLRASGSQLLAVISK